MPDTTVIYYTSNKENERFETNIRKTLLEMIGDMPLISVSQKPINLGRNICVGDLGASVFNAWRQLQIGVNETKTKFICTAESDTLYPKDYFNYEPKNQEKFHLPNRCYILFKGRKKTKQFFRKPMASEGMIVCNREFLKKRLDDIFIGKPQWSISEPQPNLYTKRETVEFDVSVPVVQFKTNNNMHTKVPMNRREALRDLPYWGGSHDLIRKYE